MKNFISYYQHFLEKSRIFLLLLLSFFLSGLFSADVFAQRREIGTPEEFITNLSSKYSEGKNIMLSVTATELEATINLFQGNPFIVAGDVVGTDYATFKIAAEGDSVYGFIILPEAEKAYEYYMEGGLVYVEEQDIHDLVCTGLTGPEEEKNLPSVLKLSALEGDVYKQQSYPEGDGVIYLDFDGEYVEDPNWNGGEPIDAQHSGFTETEIYEIYTRISEDFAPFTVNVTTDVSVFNAAPINRRIQCIFTPTNFTAYSGVASLGSFNSMDSPCWVFSSSVPGAATVGSHEIGHAFSLRHDGLGQDQEYYSGHNDWRPIMGRAQFSHDVEEFLVQWSKGEYTNASNTEDDIAIITGPDHGIAFRPDEAGNSIAGAVQLQVEDDGSITSKSNRGIVLNQADIDVFEFSSSGGKLEVQVNPNPYKPNLDILATLTDTEGNILAEDNPLYALDAKLSVTLQEGTYYLHIQGTGAFDPLTDGYSDYGSIGPYSIKGKIPVLANPELFVNITEPGLHEVFPSPADITISAEVSGTEAVEQVEFYNGNILIGIDDAEPYSVIWQNVASGHYEIQALAKAVSGIEVSAFQFLHVNLPPAIEFTIGSERQTVRNSTDGIFINMTAEDPENDVFMVELFKEQDLIGISRTESYAIYFDNIPVGTFPLYAVVTDGLGLTDTATIIFTRNPPLDCNGDEDGLASIDACGLCTGGNSPVPGCYTPMEAEIACIFDGQVENSATGFQGEGYLNLPGGSNSQIIWNVYGNYDLDNFTASVIYSNGNASAAQMQLVVNNQALEVLDLPSTSSWDEWNYVELNIPLSAGDNVVQLVSVDGSESVYIDLLGLNWPKTYADEGDCNIIITSTTPQESENVACFPNPFINVIRIDASQRFSYSIISMDGAVVEQGSGKDSVYAGQQLKPGIYLVKVNTGNELKVLKVNKL